MSIMPSLGHLRIAPTTDVEVPEDVAHAIACLRLAGGHAVGDRAMRKALASPAFRKLFRSLLDSRPAERLAWVDAWLQREAGRNPDRDRVATAIELARPYVVAEPDDPEPDDQGPPRFDLKALDAADFARAKYAHEWLVKGFLVDRQAAIIGGDRKSLKTSTMVDLAVSIAAAVPFLGQFEIPRPRRCLFLSGESGAATLQETLLRVCRAKGVDPEDLRNQLFVSFELPRLGNPDDLQVLTEFIRGQDLQGRGIEVVIIDPLYLCLSSGGAKVDTTNLFEVGPLLKRVADLCLEAGATPLIVHHLRKNRADPLGRPELEDLAYAGVQEFARQWIMLGRRERYVPGTGEHRLWLSFGGSAGHSGDWALDIDEGVNRDDFGGRRWDARLTPAGEAQAQAVETAVVAQVEKREARARIGEEANRRKARDDAEAAFGKLCKAGPQSKTGWRDLLGWNTTRMGDALETLLAQARVWPTEFVGTRGIQKGYTVTPPSTTQSTQSPQSRRRTTPDDAGLFVPSPASESRTPDAGLGWDSPLKGGPTESPASGVGSVAAVRRPTSDFFEVEESPASGVPIGEGTGTRITEADPPSRPKGLANWEATP